MNKDMNIIEDFEEKNVNEISEKDIEFGITLIRDAFELNDLIVDDIHLDNNGEETGAWWVTIDAPYGVSVLALTLICQQLEIPYDCLNISSSINNSKMVIVIY